MSYRVTQSRSEGRYIPHMENDVQTRHRKIEKPYNQIDVGRQNYHHLHVLTWKMKMYKLLPHSLYVKSEPDLEQTIDLLCETMVQ